VCAQAAGTPPGRLNLLITALLVVSIIVVLTAGTLGAGLFLVGYGVGWAHSVVRSP
jgi:hypothetical protein